MNFEAPTIDWSSPELFQEFQRFRNHCSFVFQGPLSATTDKEKAGWLGTWIGAEGREIYKTLPWASNAEKEKPDKVLDRLEKYVQPRKNNRVARHKLRMRKQDGDESFDKFVKDLRILMMDCDYAEPNDIMIDCIVDGIYNEKAQQKLLEVGDKLTLARAIEIGQQTELSKKQLQAVRSESRVEQPVNALKRQGKEPEPRSPPPPPPSPRGQCMRCGRDSHSATHGKCPAVGTTCTYCSKPNHWKTVCQKRARDVRALQEHEPEQTSSLRALCLASTRSS